MANLYLPQKSSKEVNYTVTLPGTYTWTAPDALANGASYPITVSMWAGGSGGSSGSSGESLHKGGYGGAGGGWAACKVTVVPGTVYTFRVGVGGAGGAAIGGGITPVAPGVNLGAAGGNTSISDGSGLIVSAIGGSTQPGALAGAYFQISGVATGGGASISQAAKVSSFLSITGGSGGVGGRSPTDPAGNGIGVAAAYSQPGGSGGLRGNGPNYASSTGRGGGAGASAQRSGANGGAIIGDSGGHGGGGGGAGYNAPAAGGNTQNVNYPSNRLYYGAPGGKGGDGRLTFSFIVIGGSSGIAPV